VSSQQPPYITDKKYPILYITGGSTGAQSLNRLMFPIISTLLKTFTVIHQVGSFSLSEAQSLQATLSSFEQKRYIVQSHIPIHELAWILDSAKLVVGRSGANTVVELAALGKVAIFIPLPWSAGNEQQQNAQWLAKHGGAIVLSQQGLNAEHVLETIMSLSKNPDPYKNRASVFAKSVPRDGVQRFIRQIDSLL
jgi:UDP-N-acetylglucosamine--N-acetylmuramyl-(pentapeptide) pyrophosphoryl-undecaprenol N-acetylglucosamine transferase